MLSISEQEFLSFFPGKEHLWHLLNTKPKNKEELIKKYLPSKLWRLNNIYKIIDKVGDPCTFKMNRAQFYVYSKHLIHPRLIVLKSRQQGISTLWLVSYSDDAIFYSNFNNGLMAQDREAASLLLERTKYLWDNFSPDIAKVIGRRLVKDNATELGFNNNSSLFIRTSFRSATLHRLHVSELGKIANKYPDRAKEVRTGTLQALAAGNTGIIESTAEGANIFKTMWDQAEIHAASNTLAAKDFLPVFLPWLDDPDCVEFEPQNISQLAKEYFLELERKTGRQLTTHQKNFWVVQERELEGDIHQEYPATPLEAFSAAKDGTYWARKYLEQVVRRGHIIEGLYEEALDVYGVMDLGRNDYMVLTFFQVWRDSIRVIHEYHNTGEGLKHYAQYIIKTTMERGWSLKEIGLPHDGVVVDLSEENYRTRQEILYDYGITNTVILSKQSVQSGIELVREAMPYLYFDITCTYIDLCMLGYTKEWNDTLHIWRDTPKRTVHSHGADTVRYMVQYCHSDLGFEFPKLKIKSRGQDASVVDGVSI